MKKGNRTRLTERDKQILSFLREYKLANTSILASLFFDNSTRNTTNRMKKLYELNKVNRKRENYFEEYKYYINSCPRNEKHTLEISRAYSYIMKKYEVIKIKREYTLYIGNREIRADLLVIVKINGVIKPYIIEVDLIPYKGKYEAYINGEYWKQMFPIEPQIISIGKNRPKTTIDIKFININELNKDINILE